MALPTPPAWSPTAVRPIGSGAGSEAGSIEQTYLALLESVAEIVWSGVADRGTVFVSGGVESISGFTTAEVLALPGNPWIDRAHEDDRARIDAAYRTAIAGSPVAVEYRWQRKDGAWIWLRNRTSLRYAEGADTLDSFLSEITEQRRLQQQIRRLQAMEAISHRTGAIAHDFRNLLTVILGSGQFLSETLPESDSTRADVEAILDAANRATALTGQLLGFSRRSLPETATVHLDSIVDSLPNIPCAETVATAAPRAAAVPDTSRGTETILVIEDNDETRTILRRVLESLGYRVIEAATGHEALAACEVHVDPIDLVLSDVVMADINGPEVVNRIQAGRPQASALFMSGHARPALLRDGRLQGNAQFIQKPFRHDAFARKVREVLNAR